jgi:hypothetical protein
MVCDFLDALDIAHNGKGLIDDLPSEPAADKVAKAVDLLISKYPSPSVFVYLHLFSGMDSQSWTALRGLLETCPELSAEKALSPS